MMKQQYIHYGHEMFDNNLFIDISNMECFPKPKGGLWGTPLNARFGWKEWCEQEKFEQFNENIRFLFTLKEEANVVHIRTAKDVLNLPQQKNPLAQNMPYVLLDFEEIKNKGVDALELHLSEQEYSNTDRELKHLLWLWDCDCILVLNKDVIIT